LRSRIIAALGALFNFLTLNIVLLVLSAPIVTIPVTAIAAWVALDRWRGDGEDRVLREFFTAFRSTPVLRTTLAVGVPLAVVAAAVEEVHYFAHGNNLDARACFGLGLASLVIALTSLGYVLLLVARQSPRPAAEIWSISISLALRNLFVTGPLFLVELGAATFIALLDPALLVIGLPIVVLALMRRTAQFGVGRGSPPRGGPSGYLVPQRRPNVPTNGTARGPSPR
jgi:hypothetical protein